VIQEKFDYISLCFCDWESAEGIVQNRNECRNTALSSLNNGRKMDAIISIATEIHEKGFDNFKQDVLDDPVSELQKLPFIGPVTVFHLGKNLGMPLAKPDRHLQRITSIFNYGDTQTLCEEISSYTKDPINVVDLVLWRFAIVEKDYLKVINATF
jgi:hypothetical protein